MTGGVIWKTKSIYITIATTLFVGGFLTWLVMLPAKPVPVAASAPTPVTTPEPTGPTAIDWTRCIDSSMVPDNKSQTFSVLLKNKCAVTLNEFLVTFKLFDPIDARIGWVFQSVSALEPGEKVRWIAKYPEEKETHPEKLDVSRVQAFKFEKDPASK